MLVLYAFIWIICLVLAVLLKVMPKDNKIALAGHFKRDRTISCIRKTDPSEDALTAGTGFVMHKLTLALIIICAGSFLAMLYEFREFDSNELIDGRYIIRNGYGEEAKKVRLKVRNEANGEEDTIDISVSERRYTDDELDIMAVEAEEIMYDIVLNGNASLDRICTDMNFPALIEGYPFRLSWRTDDPLLLGSRGLIDKDRLNRIGKTADIYEGVLTGIHVEFSYEDYLKEVDFYARIYPADEGNELSLAGYMTEVIKEEDEATREEEYLKLPESAGNSPVDYEEVHDNSAVIILIMAFILAAGMYYREDKELNDKVRARDKQLAADYPGLVNKFVLFYSAGLTTRGIWSKLCKDYRSRRNNGEDRRYLYEEMLICEGRMNEGLGELSAYEGFAARCALHKYRQFISLVGQAIGKGRSDLLPLLEREVTEAFTERKNRARELGEEAGTKLLFPMLMMLLVVLIIVMVPAFIAFKM